MMIGKADKDGKKVFCRILPNGKRIEIKKAKDGGWRDVGPLPDKTDADKAADKIKLQIKAAEIRKDEVRVKELIKIQIDSAELGKDEARVKELKKKLENI